MLYELYIGLITFGENYTKRIMRYFAEVAYLGTNYHGWQVQPNAITVQEKLNYVLSKILRDDIEIIGSGRTDTGVHCSQQFAQFDTETNFKIKDLIHRANAFLPYDITIKDIRPVKADAHARFDALKRSYTYKITLKKDPFQYGLAYHLKWTPDFDLLQKGSEKLLKHTDFEAFSKVHSDVHTHDCDLYKAEWTQEENLLTFHVTANRFLRGMIRIMVGNLIQVGLGKMDISELDTVLENKDRKKAARFLVDGHGLYLSEVQYPDEIWLD